MTRLTLPLFLMTACTEKPPGKLDYILSNESIDLGVASYATDEMPEWAVTVQNNMAVILTMSATSITGSPEDIVVFKSGAEPLVQVEPGETGSVSIAVSPTRMAGWTDGEYQWTLSLAFSADVPVQSTTVTDTAAYGAPTERVSETLTLPVYLEIECDVDGDGVEASECEATGGDCDDRSTVVYGAISGASGHPELCDGLDNDCNNVVDDAANCGDSGG